MAYWLVKSEPSAFSWPDQVKAKVEPWNGVRNHQANKNLKTMARGDRCFFYHSVDEKQIVGVVEVVRTWYPDPRAPEPVSSAKAGSLTFCSFNAQQKITESTDDESPSFAPNGKLIVYATRAGGRDVLMTTTLDGRIKAKLVASTADVREPTWGPFGR